MLGSTRVPKRARAPLGKKRFRPKKRPIQARSRLTYDSLLAAAARLLERRGYAALTTNHVAREAGVAIGSVYEYFGGKDAIVAEVVRRTLSEVASEIACSFRDALERGFEARLGEWISACFIALGRRAKLMRVLWMDVPFLWELEEVQALPELLIGIARQGVPAATSPWLLRDPEAGTYLLTVMIRAAIMETVVSRPSHLSAARVEASLTSLLTRLLLAPGETAT